MKALRLLNSSTAALPARESPHNTISYIDVRMSAAQSRLAQTDATVLGRLKGWLLGVLAMLALKDALRVVPRACGAAARRARRP